MAEPKDYGEALKEATQVTAGPASRKFDLESLFPSNNPVFTGGFGLAVLAGGAAVLRSASALGMVMLRRHLLVTLEVTSKDRAYPWVLAWLSAQGTRTQHLSVETRIRTLTGGSSKTEFGFVPGPGQHLIRYGGRWMGVQRSREQQMLDLNTGKPWEKVSFVALGRDTSPFEKMLQEAYDMANMQEEGKTIVYTNWGSEWRPFGHPRRRRELDSVILDQGLSDRLLADISEWRNSAQWYMNRGIPYRRGYLLHGPPGSGKTSFIMALAGHLDYNICVLNLAERGLTDDRLALALSVVPERSLVLLEDIDAAFPRRDGDAGLDHQHGSEVTFSGLLNTLDGVAASEERIVFMTTNHIERLDPALIRPGRVDMVELVGDATPFQTRSMFAKFYPEADDVLMSEFVAAVQALGTPVSMAMLQGHFLRYKDQPLEAFANVWQLTASSASGHSLSAGITAVNSPPTRAPPKGGRRTLTVDQVDRMVFNPQPGWDKDL